MASTNNDGPQYPAQGGAKISGDHSLNMATQGVQGVSATCDPVLDVAQGVPGCSATCDTVLPAGNPPTREDAGGRLPPSRKKGKGKRAGCGAAAQSQVTSTETSAKPVVASGSKSSTTEVNTAASAAATLGQELPGTSTAAADADRGVAGHPLSPYLEEELTEGSYPPSESADEEMVLDSPREAAPDVSAPSSSAKAAARGPAGTTGQKRKTESGPTPPQATKKKKKSKRGSSSRLVTFEQAEKDDLLGVVLVQGNPYQILMKDQIAWLRTALGNQVDAAIDSDAAFIPRFTESGVRNGRFCLSCANGESFS